LEEEGAETREVWVIPSAVAASVCEAGRELDILASPPLPRPRTRRHRGEVEAMLERRGRNQRLSHRVAAVKIGLGARKRLLQPAVNVPYSRTRLLLFPPTCYLFRAVEAGAMKLKHLPRDDD
jgi:hypothetical protein